MSTNDILLGLGLVLVLAVGAQLLARRLGLPAGCPLVLAVGVRFFVDLVVPPEDPYSIRMLEGPQ